MNEMQKLFDIKLTSQKDTGLAGLGDTIHVFQDVSSRKESKTQQQKKSIDDFVRESEANGNPVAAIIAQGDGTYAFYKSAVFVSDKPADDASPWIFREQ